MHRAPKCDAAARRSGSIACCAASASRSRPTGKDKVLNLLAVEFETTDTPAGVVTLVFSGGPALRLEVECLEVELVDLGPAKVAETRPANPAEAPDARH